MDLLAQLLHLAAQIIEVTHRHSLSGGRAAGENAAATVMP
jgi:hypothetical protein